ncbi:MULTISPECIES: MerR family transcriptional regulator [Aerococcus]|uniref:MerR family transcriptional regulator n=1 Tax=Aerococcus mictus TaxID=2976810 RepID=A0A1E9PH58_9LACT|nr:MULTISPECIES: MerR family transcriptional regulator [Aerococcus]MBU5611296.1 MerR family transcriptional regulator [Aerococcus urinae]MCY3034001.1 MerR family transcriptional regulator [Aerococcus mictus]MCY3065769.1 MerR family transcriptional regulator [Aerococcus mictus]MCY3066475.1 MerR family transcriptional regulator [Aerococcus mictus]MCY3071400.1 MerR family transcriptional regulator [Aerococcus mictus]
MQTKILNEIIYIRKLLQQYQKRYLKKEEVMDEFNIGYKTLEAWEANGLIKIEVPTESSRRFFYDKKDIEEFMNNNKY